ncbi:MAG: hypothetical protein WC560_11530 [Syntrophales bacterium]
MDAPYWYYVADAVQNWVTTTALLIGGVWAVYRFWLRRENQTAIDLDVNCYTERYSDLHVVFVEVTVANRGSVAVTASTESPAYEDDVEVVRCSGHLRLRPIRCVPAGQGQIEWFPTGGGRAPVEGDIEADLLSEYAVDGRPIFWMEPGETYKIGATLMLLPGQYMGMVTFVGNREPGEFWRQLFLLNMPPRSKEAA